MDDKKLRVVGQKLTLVGQLSWLFLIAVGFLACSGFCLWIVLAADYSAH